MKTPHKATIAFLTVAGFIGFSTIAAAQDINLPRRLPDLKRLEITNTVTKNSPVIDVRMPALKTPSLPTPDLGTRASQVASDFGSAANSVLQNLPSIGLPTPANAAPQDLTSAISSMLPRQGSVQISIPSNLLPALSGNLPGVGGSLPNTPAQ